MASSIKMDELLVKWLGSDTVFENVDKLVHSFQTEAAVSISPATTAATASRLIEEAEEVASTDSPRGVVIPPFYPKRERRQRWQTSRLAEPDVSWLWLPTTNLEATDAVANEKDNVTCVRDRVQGIYKELAVADGHLATEQFGRITKEVCRFPSFFNGSLHKRILREWNAANKQAKEGISQPMLEWYWMREMENFDSPERFFRLLKQPDNDYVGRDDFLPYIKDLLNDHPVCGSCVCLLLRMSTIMSWLTRFKNANELM
jgi:hypothetical protein